MAVASPRARRRRRRLVLAGVLVAAAALLVVIAPGAPEQKPEVFHGDADVLAESRPDVTVAERAAITATLQGFLAGGLARGDLANAWNLATPQLRGSTDRERWLAGDVPFIEYHAGPFGPDAWRAVDIRGPQVVLELLVQPAPGWDQGPAVFAIDLRRSDTGWRVASVYPQVLYSSADELPSVFSEKDLQAGGPATPRPAKPRLDGIWLLAPIGVFTALLVALALAIVRQRRRA